MTYKTEFPDFGDLDIELPPDFEDTSWRNDTCPSFRSMSRSLLLYIDYADPAAREYPESTRFTVERVIGETFAPDNSNVTTLLHTDDWSAVDALLKMDFASKLEAIEVAKAWIEQLAKAHLLFQFDEDPATILSGCDEDKFLFTEEQSAQLRERVKELYSFDWSTEGEECPIGYALRVIGD